MNQSGKQISYINANMWNPKNTGVYNLIYKAEVERHLEQTDIKEGWWEWEELGDSN